MVFLSSACMKDSDILKSINKLSTITKNIELSGGSHKINGLKEKIINLKKDGFNFLVHSYFPPPKDGDFVLNFADTSSQTRDFIIDSMEYVKNLNIEYYSIHAGFKKKFNIKYENNQELLVDGDGFFSIKNVKENIVWFYDTFDVELALENLFPNNNQDGCFASSIDEIKTILKLDDRVNLLLDLGHLKISSRKYNFNYLHAVELLFNEYIDKIKEIHVSENNGYEDNHNIIHSDSVQYMIIDKYKKQIKQKKINLIIEARDSDLNKLNNCFLLFNDLIGD